jgi:predicted anti-sigma-YlaC factor YlaD
MNQHTCAHTKDLIPGYLAERLSQAEAESVRSHIDTCEDCRAEADLIGRLRLTTPRPPVGLSASVSKGLRGAPAPGTSRRWWLAAAATVVFAVGMGLIRERVPGGPLSEALGVMVAEQVDDEFWPGDETLVAGGLVWDDLSDEEMTALLEDWDDEA